MAFSCRLYKSTGFNTINVPDRPSLLDSFSYVDTDVIDVLSTYNNSVIRVKLSQAPDWQYYDYLRIGSGSNIADRAYYAITGFRFTSPDVIEFSVVQDTWLTLGGIDAFTGNDPEVKIISGTTQRHHIAKEDDTYAEYNEPDDMLVPSDPLMVLVTQRIFTMDERYVTPNRLATNNVTIVRTSIDLDELGKQDPDIVTFPKTSIEGDITGEIPSPADFCYPKISNGTTTIGLVHGSSRLFDVNGSGALSPDPLYGGERNFELPGERLTVIYIPSGQDFTAGPFGSMTTLQRENMKKALGRARGMGYDTAITASYSLPQGAVSIVTYDSKSSNSTIKSMYPEHYFAARGSSGDNIVNLDNRFEFEYIAHNASFDINNLRATKGEWFKYVMFSLASGDKLEFLGEEIVKSTRSQSQAGTIYKPETENKANSAPILININDIRPDGCPYFTCFNERSQVNLYQNSIKGLKWTEAPIRYEVNSGAAIEGRRLVNNTKVRDVSARFENTLVKAQQVRNDANSVIGAVGDFITGDWAGAANKIQSPVLRNTVGGSDIGDRAVYGYDEVAQNQVRRFIERKAEQEEFFVNTSVQVPEINFPMNDSIKEAVGNGALLLRYSASVADVQKFDKILNMYGYRDTRPLEDDMFSNRSKYNYIEAAGVTFGGKAAKFLRDDLANMFTTGIRIWHVAPDPTLYVGTSNS